MSRHAYYVWDETLPQLTWPNLLPRGDSQGTRASISRRPDSLEKRIRGHVPSQDEIVQKCAGPFESTNPDVVLSPPALRLRYKPHWSY